MMPKSEIRQETMFVQYSPHYNAVRVTLMSVVISQITISDIFFKETGNNVWTTSLDSNLDRMSNTCLVNMKSFDWKSPSELCKISWRPIIFSRQNKNKDEKDHLDYCEQLVINVTV